jgi:uncharacterized membrane protein YkoI
MLNRMIRSAAIITLLARPNLSSAFAKDEEYDHGKKDEKAPQAEISLQKAAKIALKSFRIKSGELEKENGKRVWSFDIALSKSKDIVEVQVDAKTGKVVSVEIETAKKEAAKEGGKSITKCLSSSTAGPGFR